MAHSPEKGWHLVGSCARSAPRGPPWAVCSQKSPSLCEAGTQALRAGNGHLSVGWATQQAPGGPGPLWHKHGETPAGGCRGPHRLVTRNEAAPSNCLARPRCHHGHRPLTSSPLGSTGSQTLSEAQTPTVGGTKVSPAILAGLGHTCKNRERLEQNKHCSVYVTAHAAHAPAPQDQWPPRSTRAGGLVTLDQCGLE